ncbi:MAG: DEAD/DEAH box helicase [Alcanivoracaceae bacterium]|nr:DEAD/DEAH box helicase [Alcanivoracaceae bacterium]
MTDVASRPGFDSLGLSSAVCSVLDKLGYQQPTPIQGEVIPHMLSGRDVVGLAQTGTGKTAAFALPLISRLGGGDRGALKALVLAPTRELALQVTANLEQYAGAQPGFSVVSLCGGMPFGPQLKALRGGVTCVVGTPGRVIDHLEKGTLKLSELQCLVLDEADEMLRMGFIDDVQQVMDAVPGTCQVALFSATMPAPIRRLAQRYLKDPAEVTIKSATSTAPAIRQRYLFTAHRDKPDALLRVLELEAVDAAIVFTRTREATVDVANQLCEAGYRAAALNGDLAQAQREQVVDQLKRGKLDIVVATDVAARGLDVPRISHVINFDIPFDAEVYTHRIGRTGRAGRAGDAILFVTPKDKRLLAIIERVTRQKVEEMPLPDAAAINARREQRFVEKLEAAMASADESPMRGVIARWLEKRDMPVDTLTLAAALADIGLDGKPFFAKDRPRPARRPAAERQASPAGQRPRVRKAAGRAATSVEQGMVRYKIAVGHKDGVKPGNIVGAIANEAGLNSRVIGRIDIDTRSSTVDLPDNLPAKTVSHLKKVWVSGRQLDLQPV